MHRCPECGEQCACEAGDEDEFECLHCPATDDEDEDELDGGFTDDDDDEE